MKERKDRFKREDKDARLDPYSEIAARTYESLLKERVVLLNGEIKENVIEKIAVPILNMSNSHPRTPIKILINSEGGAAEDGQAIVDLLTQCKTPIITVGLGKVMSMAFDIFLAGDMRIAQPNTLFMAHAGYDGIFDRMPMITDIAVLHQKHFERWARYYASRTKWSYEQWLEIITSGKDFYFFPEDALKIGIITDITPNEKGLVNTIQSKSSRKKSKTHKRKEK